MIKSVLQIINNVGKYPARDHEHMWGKRLFSKRSVLHFISDGLSLGVGSGLARAPESVA